MVKDSGKILDEFAKRLKIQKINLPYELVLLYYGHGEETLKRLKSYTSKIIRIQPNKFKFGKCRDLICSHASGKYIVTASLDALPTNSYWLQELINPIKSGRADVIQGEIRCPNKNDSNYLNFFYWENNYMFYYSSEGNKFIKRYGGLGLSCINLAFHKNVWEKCKFTGVSFCEDKIFQKRLFRSGFTTNYNKKASVFHAHTYTTIKPLFKRVSNEGLGWKQVGEKYNIYLFLKDIFRIDLHFLAIKSLINKKLKYRSEIFFFLIRPLALYWGNHFAKRVY